MTNFFRALGDAGRSLKRNLSVTLASVATVAATLLIFGVFLMLALTINGLVRNVESQTVVRVFMQDAATQEQNQALEGVLKSQPGVKSVTYENKVQAFNNAKANLEKGSRLLEGFDANKKNPYPNSFIVHLDKPEFAQGLVTAAEGKPGVESIANDSDTINLLISWAKTIRTIGVIIFIILVLIALFLIGNSIKLAVFGRRREIEIMKFVGATNWFIRGPFILEGILIGLMGAILAVILLYLAYQAAFNKAQVSMPFLRLPSPTVIRDWFSWQFVLAGMAIGALGSFLSIRKHLKV